MSEQPTSNAVSGDFELTGRVAVVTGGSRGIGLAIAKGFARAGASVVVASRKADACVAAVREIEAGGGRALAAPTHVADAAALQSLVDRTAEHFGGIDVLVNNAANGLAQPVGAFTIEAWDKSLAVNLRGPVFLTQYALPYLKLSRHASVINVLTAGVFLRSGSVAIYAIGKSGLLAFTRAAADAFAPLGIRVNALAPGTVDTDMTRGGGPEHFAMMEKSSPMGRMADAEEMVGPALLLASDAGSYITGQCISADGGLAVH